MPGLVRKLVVFAAVDGLILQPITQRNQHSTPSLRISYKSHKISALGNIASRDIPSTSLDAHGIVGLLSVASNAYLISISRRQQVALIRGSPIYVITGIAIIPLSSQLDASTAIQQAKETSRQESGDDTSLDQDIGSSDEEGGHLDDSLSGDGHHDPSVGSKTQSNSGKPTTSTSIAQDVIGKQGQYGRFAERWFSSKGWKTDGRRAQGMSDEASIKEEPQGSLAGDGNARIITPGSSTPGDNGSAEGDKSTVEQQEAVPSSEDTPARNVTNNLLPKLLRTTKMLLASRSFFYSYDYDITRRIGSQERRGGDGPLHQGVDPLFFWNHHLASPFIDGSHHAYVLPLMQGFVGQRVFSIDAESTNPAGKVSEAKEDVQDVLQTQKDNAEPSSFLITLISRRTVMRPGLRYLRRGVDDQGHTANSVETEQILSKPSWPETEKVYSFTQIRGSIPLFFSQSPYAFKPVPVLQHSFETNHRAFKVHFTNIVNRYGAVQAALLVDKAGGEASIGEEYEKQTKHLNEEGGVCGTLIGFEWFDFHTVCKGMKFENVSLLVDSLEPQLARHGWTVDRGGRLLKKQIGVVRTNCMDCLDRTNVAQSACASRILEKQLKEEGIDINLEKDPDTQWFNTLWADNGDAISKQYSSTAALKGDYTRTRKRNYRGALNDFGLTLSRYYNNIVNDFFSQAAIDYLLGKVDPSVFEDFEAEMMSGDPAISMRKIQANAIETSMKIVIPDQEEDFIGGWTLLSPQQPNTVRTFPFDEIVLLLTDVALYAVRFDWNIEKVSSFERVDLRSILGIMRGTYISSTLTTKQMDEQRNVGFIIKYKPGDGGLHRRNTRSLSSMPTKEDDPAPTASPTSPSYLPSFGVLARLSGRGSAPEIKLLAFKALPARSSHANAKGAQETHTISEKELIRDICEVIEKAASAETTKPERGEEDKASDFIEENDIISLSEAKKSTGYLEQWGHSLKRFVWA